MQFSFVQFFFKKLSTERALHVLASDIAFQPLQGLGAQDLPKNHPAQRLVTTEKEDVPGAIAKEVAPASAASDNQPTADTTKAPSIDPYDFDAAHPRPRTQMVRKFFKSRGNGPVGEKQRAATGSSRLNPSIEGTGPARRPRTRGDSAPAQRTRSPSIEIVKGNLNVKGNIIIFSFILF